MFVNHLGFFFNELLININFCKIGSICSIVVLFMFFILICFGTYITDMFSQSIAYLLTLYKKALKIMFLKYFTIFIFLNLPLYELYFFFASC